jgi:hypothetical protein
MNLKEALSAIERVRKLHKPINGAYDDLACSHCTDILLYTFDPELLKNGDPIYVDYPCSTILEMDNYGIL